MWVNWGDEAFMWNKTALNLNLDSPNLEIFDRQNQNILGTWKYAAEWTETFGWQ